MQLISNLLIVLSFIVLLCALLFLYLWHRAYRNTVTIASLREEVKQVGISTILEYPDTTASLYSVVEESYPRSEVILITDMQRSMSTFGGLIRNFRLIKVNHHHLAGARALYRSRHRAFRRVVVIDLPIEYRSRAYEIASEVASYDYLMRLPSSSVVAKDAVGHCANILASYSMAEAVSLRTIVGSPAKVEHATTVGGVRRREQPIARAIAWRRGNSYLWLFAALLPAIIVAVAHIMRNALRGDWRFELQ